MPLVTIERRAEPFFPFRRCLCMDNRQGTFVGALFALFSSLIMLICVVLDQYATSNPTVFQIPGGFDSRWREMQWKSWVACNATMLVCHSLAVLVSFVLVIAIRSPEKPIGKLYNLVVVVRLWFIWMWMYIIAELGVQTFQYSWYGWHVFRLPFTCFVFVFWVLKTGCNIVFVFVAMSYNAEAKEELHEGVEEYDESSAAELYKSAAMAPTPAPAASAYGGSGYMPAQQGYMPAQQGYMPGQPGPSASQPALQGQPIMPSPSFTQAPYGTMGSKPGYPPMSPPMQAAYPPYGSQPMLPPGFVAQPSPPGWSSSQTNLMSPGTPGRPASGIQQFPAGVKGAQVNVDSHEDDF